MRSLLEILVLGLMWTQLGILENSWGTLVSFGMYFWKTQE